MDNNAAVQKQYMDWIFPEPIEDLDIWTSHHSQLCDPAHHHSIIWPERDRDFVPSILVAGCGTSQAAILAYTNPKAKIVGIDFSANSLEHAAKLKAKHNLANLELQQMDLRDVAALGRTFDLVYATGVLHHLTDPQKGLEALAQVVADNGVMCLMLYAKYGRAGVEMLQEALRTVGADQTSHGITMTRSILGSLTPQHAAAPYLRGARNGLNYDACVVDTFLHKQERSYTVPDIMDLVTASGLAFQGWTDNLDYYPDGTLNSTHPAYQIIAALPEEKQWVVTELLYQFMGCHSFLVRKHASNHYRINFDDESWLQWIPSQRYLLDVVTEGKSLILNRGGHSYRLDEFEKELFQKIDGKKPCGKLISNSSHEKARKFFKRMFCLGHFTFSLR